MKIIENGTLDLTDEIVISVEQYYELLQKAKQQTMQEIARVRLNPTQEYLLRVEASKYMYPSETTKVEIVRFMSRIHKYRVWDRQEKKMIPVDTLNFGSDGSGRTITLWLEKGKRLGVVGENCDLMEFTGMKDMNDKEVYEGDIVQFQTFDAQGVVSYTPPRFRASEHALLGYKYEIIGNIYANPGLMAAHEAQK